MSDIDYFADSQEVVASEDSLKRIRVLAAKLVDKQNEVSALEESLKKAKEEVRILETIEVPSAMDAVGIPFIGLPNGLRVDIVDYVHASIPKKTAAQAFTWLRENGEGDLIKNKVAASFDRGQEALVQKLMDVAKGLEISLQVNSEVHWGTLTAWAKEQLKNGRPIPMEVLGVYAGRKATIK